MPDLHYVSHSWLTASTDGLECGSVASMIKHIVLWKLKEQANGNDQATNARLIKVKLEGLRGRIPGLLSIEVGLDFSRTDTSADVALCSEFIDRAALDAYQAHPEHAAIKPFIVAAVAERRLADYDVVG